MKGKTGDKVKIETKNESFEGIINCDHSNLTFIPYFTCWNDASSSNIIFYIFWIIFNESSCN